MRSAKQVLFGSIGAAVALTGLAGLTPTPAQADVTDKIAAFPYSQPWSDPGLITANNAWSGVSGVQGYRGDELTAVTATDPQTITADGAATPTNVTANSGGSLNTNTSGGVVESEADQTIALQGSGTADAPHVVFHLDLTGAEAPTFAFNARDLDGSADNAAQQIAVQYRIGDTGAYTNLPDGFVADATDANAATKVTPVSAPLPAATAGESSVFVRVLTTNAVGNDEWVGIDDVSVTTGGVVVPAPLSATDPGDKTVAQNSAIAPITLQAAGGTTPYTWSTTALPAGLTLSGNQITGTPTALGTTEVVTTVTDSADPGVTAEATFTITVEAPLSVTPIAAIQGPGTASPEVGNTVTTTGVVTAMYRDPSFTASSIDGMYIQTAGTGGATDATPGSDAIFVYGANALPAGVEIGDSVQVTGEVSEFAGTTEITPGVGGVEELDAPLAAVMPRTIAYPTTEADREAQEGMLLAPTDNFTVTNVYNANTFAEIGLATGDKPLVQPTEEADDDDADALDAIRADNAKRGVVLDDGTSVNYLTNAAAKNQPLPWISPANPVRVGAKATLAGPVILEYRNNTWKFQPPAPVYDDGASTATFQDTRPANLVPAEVGGDLKIATFNVLNYFNTTGEQYVANGAAQSPPVNTQCSYYDDRAGNHIGNNTCGVVTNGNNAGNGPRGAATTESLARQRAKIITAINALDADIVGLQEIENSIKLVGETDRDDALSGLVTALNDAAGAGTWKFVHSPGEATTSTAVGEQDVIRPAFIYRAASVQPVGQSDILFGTTEFANAREPLAQAFKARGALDTDAFAVILNHFKSKGDSTPPATGDNATLPDTGAFNGDRTRQATKLVEFANDFAQARGTEAVFIAGDLNSYSMEDPIWTLEQGGFELIDSPGEESYSFSGLSGSLDHVLGNDAAVAMVSGADIWDINAAESVAFQYSRFNYNVTDFWQPNLPFAASDHNPEIVGINVPEVTGERKEIQVLGTNDFHGRILPSGGDSAGASVLSGAVKQLRGDNPNTVFVAAGDLVGASTFESFIQNDEPTIDALNEAGLEVSAAGNHEFDQGYEDLVGRIQSRASWEYIAANVEEPAGRDDLAETWTKTIDGVKVGFVGAVTEDLPSLVSPDGIEGVTVTDIVEATNTAAADLKADGADLVILLVHEGSPVTDCTSPNFTDANTVWGNITQNTSADVDAIVSGHTHLAYNCSFPVAQWASDGRDVTKRPVVSAGQYGQNLNQLVFTYDEATGDLVAVSQDIIGIAGTGYPSDPAVDPIVDDAKAQADVLGARVLGKIEGPFNRAKLANGSTENRGGESTLGNKVAEVQRWATRAPESGEAQIAFMNPGGLRTDMGGTVNGAARDLTYKQAAVVQPFANTLVNMDLTGAQLKTVLEQQWQRTPAGAVPSRPFLRLGVSDGFTYTYVETAANVGGTDTFTGEISGMWLNGEPIKDTETYSVTVNSFLASGGDNFFEFANGTGKADTGKVDLQAMVDYMAQYATTPLAVDGSQRAVGVAFPADAPASYTPGDHVTFDISSWTMATADDTKDAEVQVKLGETVLGSFPLDNAIGTAVYDQYGKASVDVVLPDDLSDGATELTLVGATTGTSIPVPLTVTVTEPEEIVNNTPPTITGTAKVGKVLTATPGTWTPTPTSVAYQWFANGAAIAGATGSTLTLKAGQVDQRITVKATASADGFVDASKTSAPTAAVTRGDVTVITRISPASKIVAGRTKVNLVVRVTNADGIVATGPVLVRIGSKVWGGTLKNGRVTIALGKMRVAGLKKVNIRYTGDASLGVKKATTTFRVVRR